VRRLKDLPATDIERRLMQFREITAFEAHLPEAEASLG